MNYLALVTAITTHRCANVSHGAAHALAHNRLHFGPAAERAIQGGQILAHRASGGVDVCLVTAGYPVDQDDGVDVYGDWCFAILGISRRRYLAPLRRLRAMMLAQGNGKDAAWALVRASQAADVGYHGYPDCYGIKAMVDGVAVTATTVTTRFGASVALSLGLPPGVADGSCHHQDGDSDEVLPIASLGLGHKRHPVTNPSRLARRRLGRVC